VAVAAHRVCPARSFRLPCSAGQRQLTDTVLECGPPPLIPDPDVLSQAVYWWVAATDDETVAVQVEPTPQLTTVDPLSFTMSMYQMVGPTSTFVDAVNVTRELTDDETLLAESPLRQVPSAAQLLPATGVLVAAGLLAVQVTVAVVECDPPPARPVLDVLSHAVNWWLAAVLEVTLTAQLVPDGQACTTAPDSVTISTYHTVGPTSRLVAAVIVTAVCTGTDAALALMPVRQVPSLAQLVPVTGVLVRVGVGGTGVYVLVGVGGTGVYVRVTVGGTGVYVVVGVGDPGVPVLVVVGGTGV
jgi:hypothetical protein